MTRMTAKMRTASRLREIKLHYLHQAALPDIFCTYENFTAIRDFCIARYGEAPETFSVIAKWEDGGEEEMRVHCFRTAEQAAEFCAHFEAEPFSEKECQKKVWMRNGSWAWRVHYGPLDVPKWMRNSP